MVYTYLSVIATDYCTVPQVDGIRGAVLANRQVPGGFGGTVISHNKGGQWSALQAPAVDMNSLPINCMRVIVS